METSNLENVSEEGSQTVPNGTKNSIENQSLDSQSTTTTVVALDISESIEVVDNEEKTGNFLTRFFYRKTKGMSRNQIAILLIFPFVEFFAATVISIQGPFFPKTVEEKGATLIENGLVFGVFELVVFIMAPIYGAKMGLWSPHRLFNGGIFTTSLSCLIFGFVHHIDGRFGFVFASVIIRIIEAIGDAAFVTASFSIIATEFPDSVATTFAMMETFYGLGMIVGPVVGGALYEVGGFTFPFAMMGACLFLTAVATYAFITKPTTSDVTKPVISNSSFEMFQMFKIPAIALTAYGTFAAATGIGFLTANLEPHLREEFNLVDKELQVGAIFMLNGGVYALTAPFWGKLCDKTSQPKVFSVIGSLFTIFGFILVGPLPFSSWEPSIPVVCIGLVIFGVGLGSTLVSAFILFLQDSIANGHPDDVTTHGLVSGLWTSMTALGFFVGPTIGGILNYLVGFRWGTLFILAQQLILVGLLAYFFMSSRMQLSSTLQQDSKSKAEAAEYSQDKQNEKINLPHQSIVLENDKMENEQTGIKNPNFVGDQEDHQ